MKQTKEQSISLKREKNVKQNTIVLIPACFLLTTGFWGLLFQEWKLKECGASLLPLAVLSLVMAVGLLFLKEKRERLYFPVLLALCAVAVIAVPLLGKLFSGSMGRILNQIREWLFLHTGWYSNAFTENTDSWPILILFALIAGVLTQFMVLHLRGRLVVITALAYYLLLISGTFQFSIWGMLLLLGCILTLAQGADGRSTAGLWIMAGFALVGALVLGIAALLKINGPNGTAGEKLQAYLHKNKYETTENAMPEGNLKDLNTYSPTEQAALTISMENWRTIYLRGFQGGNYTGTSWESLSPEEVEEEKELLNALQSQGFYASTQISEGWKSLLDATDETTETIRITNTGACSAYSYLPYGTVVSDNLNPYSITGEGLDPEKTKELSTDIYPVEDSYLLMQQLSDAGDNESVEAYLEKESSYRSFVYDHYLTLSDRVKSLLVSQNLKGTTGISTSQACREIRILLKERVKYDEKTQFFNHENDFLDYLLNVQPNGYSVHYATLAVMMLRSYGIPARYVEGFYIPASLTENLESGATFTVTQKQSSAWVEYYLDGVGWLLFDPVPEHKETVNYNLPVGEGDAGQQLGNMGFADENRKHQEDLEEDESDDGSEDSRKEDRTGIRALFLIFVIAGILLVLALLALIIHTIVLRRKMRRRREKFTDPDPKIGTAAILCSLRELTTRSLHIPEEAFFSNPDQMVTELLEMPEEELLRWKGVADEIQFSTHPITEETRQEAGEWLKKTEASWNAAVPLPRKILQKYILCNVY